MDSANIEKSKKEANDIWENQLKNEFTDYIKNCLMTTLKSLNAELNNFDNTMKSHIQTLDKNIEKKFDEQLSQIKEQINNNENNNNHNPVFIQSNAP